MDQTTQLTSEMSPSMSIGAAAPFYELDEYVFQDSCAELMGREPGISISEVYGTRGQKQHGIDVLAWCSDGAGVVVGQCKCYKDFRPQQIRAASDEFFAQQQDATLPLLAWRGLSLEHVGRTEDANADLARIDALYHDEPFTSYTWACFHSLYGDNDAALLSLSKAIEGEARFRKTAQTDADLEILKSDARFQALVFE